MRYKITIITENSVEVEPVDSGEKIRIYSLMLENNEIDFNNLVVGQELEIESKGGGEIIGVGSINKISLC